MVAIAIRQEIEARLAAIEAEEDVRILLAVESGSRAWGFPSPDSDYDVRFLYVRRPEAYIALRAPRDVIERPIEDVFDLNGWDLGKALGLLLKSNAVMVEWLASPIVYREAAGFRGEIERFAGKVVSRSGLMAHYLGLCQSGLGKHFSDPGAAVRLKKYFYVLRPALALLWLSAHDGLPPMRLQDLMAGLDLPPDVARRIDSLLVLKSASTEIGEGPRDPALDRFVRAASAQADACLREMPRNTPSRQHSERADALLRGVVLALPPAC